MEALSLTSLANWIVPVVICVILAVVVLTIAFGFFRHADDSVALALHIVGYICAGIIIYLIGSYMFHRSALPPEAAPSDPAPIEQTYSDAAEV